MTLVVITMCYAFHNRPLYDQLRDCFDILSETRVRSLAMEAIVRSEAGACAPQRGVTVSPSLPVLLRRLSRQGYVAAGDRHNPDKHPLNDVNMSFTCCNGGVERLGRQLGHFLIGDAMNQTVVDT